MECVKKIVYIGDENCLKCGKPLDVDDKEYCHDCAKTKHIFDRSAAVFPYSDGLKQSIYRFKYKGCREYGKWYAVQMADKLGRLIKIWSPDVIVPVPMYAKKQRARGYNQAEIIACELGKIIHVPVSTQFLKRNKNTVPMKEVSEHDRSKNLENAFIADKNVVKYKKILLVDDIYTTGATLDACAAVLKKYGVEKVYGACLCIGRGMS